MLDSFVYTFLTTLIFLYLYTYLPVKLLASKTKLPQWWDLQVSIGIALLAIIVFFLKYLLPTNVILIIYAGVVILLAIKTKQLPNISNPLKLLKPPISLNLYRSLLSKLYYLLPIILGTFLQSLPYLQSLVHGKQAVLFDIIGSHDQSWHHSLISELLQYYPPQTPGFGGVLLKNYHFFYDLIITANISLFHSSIPYALQVIYPVLISLLFGTAAYRLISQLTLRQRSIFTSLILVYFGANLAALLPIFGSSNWHLRDMILDQPIYFLFNHQTVLTIALLAYALIITHYLTLYPKSKLTAIILGVIAASLMSFKIYAFAILAAVLGTTFIYYSTLSAIYRQKAVKELIKSLLLTALITGTLSISNLLLNFTFDKSFIHLDPFWILSTFSGRIVTPIYPYLGAMLSRVQLTNDYFGIFTIYLLLFLLFTIGNLAFRLFAFQRIFAKNKSVLERLLLLTATVSFLSVFMGQQSGSAFNIIQFTPYAITFLTILAVFAVDQLNRQMVTNIFLLIVVFSIAPTVEAVKEFSRHSQQAIDSDKLTILEKLKTVEPGLVISLIERIQRSTTIGETRIPFTDFQNNIIQTMTNHRSYYSDWLQLEVLQLPHRQRKVNIDLLSKNICNFTTLNEPVFNQFENIYILTTIDNHNNNCIEDQSDYAVTTLTTTPTLSLVKLTQ